MRRSPSIGRGVEIRGNSERSVGHSGGIGHSGSVCGERRYFETPAGKPGRGRVLGQVDHGAEVARPWKGSCRKTDYGAHPLDLQARQVVWPMAIDREHELEHLWHDRHAKLQERLGILAESDQTRSGLNAILKTDVSVVVQDAKAPWNGVGLDRCVQRESSANGSARNGGHIESGAS